jgi:S1-C subfamily serine protease
MLVVFCSGCATTHIAIKNDSSFSKYKKIYLLNFKNDPRKILPKVQRHLQQLGFQVILTKEDEPVGGYQGTGFIISPEGYILTSAHIVDKEKEATVWLNDKRYEADIICIEKDDDRETINVKKSNSIEENLQASLNSEMNRSIFELTDRKALALLKIRSANETFKPVIISNNDKYQMGQEVYTIVVE